MKKTYFAIGLLSTIVINAQQFEEVMETPFKNFFYSSSAIGDVNNDGFNDVFLTGAIDSNDDTNVDTTFNEFYQNNNGEFTIKQSFDTNAVHLSDSKFIDFDNDGLIDLVTTGLSYNNITNYRQYRFKNTGTGFEFYESIDGKIYGGFEVFDINHDGKQDYALNGTRYEQEIQDFTHYIGLYENNGNGFTENKTWLPGTQNGDFKLIDINNDNELDVLIFGFNEDLDPIFHVYKNNNGNFELSQELPVISNGKMAYADFNNDGFLDLVVTGQDENYDGYLAFYINDGTGNFTENKIEGETISDSNVQVGDLNNDGYYDFVVNGNDENYDGQTKIFIYQPSENNFVKAENTNLYNFGSGGSIQLFDFNNDNHLDVLINGFDWADPDYMPYTKLYKNLSTQTNQKPNAPTELNAVVENDKIVFNWNGASDDKTPEKVLQYELSVGSQSGKADIAKYIVTTKNWYLKKETLPSDIFWSVKAIDASKVYSESSVEKVVSTLSVSENQSAKISVYPNPVKDILNIRNSEKTTSVKVYNIAGQLQSAKLISGKYVDFSMLSKGIYIVEITMQNGKKVTEKIVKN